MEQAASSEQRAATSPGADGFELGGRTWTSRLIVGTGGFRSLSQMGAALAASGTEIVTVALRRVNVADKGSERLVDHLDPKRFTYLPNTAGSLLSEGDRIEIVQFVGGG